MNRPAWAPRFWCELHPVGIWHPQFHCRACLRNCMDHRYDMDEEVLTEEGMARWLDTLIRIIERAWRSARVLFEDQDWWREGREEFLASNRLPPVPVWYVLASLEELRDVPDAEWELDGGRRWYFERLCRFPLWWSQRLRGSALPAP